MAKQPPPNWSEEIQRILSESDIWNPDLSYIEIDQSYSSRRWEYALDRLRERDKKEVIAAVLLPIVAAIVSFVSWDSLLKSLGIGLLTLIATLGVIFFLYWVAAPKELDDKLRGDLKATREQLAEEKRKLIRIAMIAKENEEKHLESNKYDLESLQRELEERHREVRDHKDRSRLFEAQATDLKEQNTVLQERVELLEASNQELQERLRPNLSIIHGGEVAPYVQCFDSGVKQYRVGIVSPVPVTDAELVANEIRIRDRFESGLHLRERHDRSEARRVALKPHKEAFMDVVSVHPLSNGTIDVLLNHTTRVEQIRFPKGHYEFELMISGGLNPPATKIAYLEVSEKYIIFKLRDGRLTTPRTKTI
jgi:hypothetical protein